MKKAILVLTGLFLSATLGAASAADYPTKPITLYVGYAAGGATDTAARIVTNQVNKHLEQPMIVNNKPGGGSAVAADFVAKSKPDGYTLFNSTITTVIQTVINPANPFKMTEFTPIVGLYSMPLVIVVKADSKFNTIEDLIDFAKKNPNKLNVGTPGMNSVHHFALEIFKREAKIEVNHIPFQGDAPGVVGVMGGHVDAAFLGLVAVAEHMKGGTMKGLAMTTSKRTTQFPNLPTLAEKGFSNTAKIFSWRGVFAPAALPGQILEKLSAAYQKAAPSPEVVSQLEKVGFTATYMNAKDFDHFVKDEYKRLVDVAQSAHMIQK
ncbi:MAG: Bug family tripartite tricarboxylate transporter substrate binding protein [Thermodesulfobacteriota bacterium]